MGGMKDKERFSAGLVSKPFWFYEYKTYAEQLNKGYTAEEIKAQALQMNLFPAAKEYRVKEILSCVSRRVMQFEPEWRDLFMQQSVSVQKLMVLLSIMADDKLFFVFMYRIYRDKLIIGADCLEASEVLSFFRLMQNESEEISQWKDTTIRKFSQSYRRLLNDAGLLMGEKIIPPLPSVAVKRYLKEHDMSAYLQAITGADE